MFSNKYKLELKKTVEKNGEKEREKVGEALIPFPTLVDFGIQAKQETKDGKPAVDEQGVPIYVDPHYDWLQTAIVDKISARVRNYFTDGVLKAGKQLPQDFEALTAETARTGEALALRREAKASFEAYLQSKNKKATTVQALGELFFNSARVLSTAGSKYVEALQMHVDGWLDTLSEEQKTRFTPKLAELADSIQAAQEQPELD